MRSRVVWLSVVLGCHGPSAPAPRSGGSASGTAELPSLSGAEAVIASPSGAPPVVVVVTAATTLDKRSEVRIATARTWDDVTTIDRARGKALGTLEVGRLIREATTEKWSPQQTFDNVGKPVNLSMVEDPSTRAPDDEPPPPPPTSTGATLRLPGEDEKPRTPGDDSRDAHIAAAGGFGTLGMAFRDSTGWGRVNESDRPMRAAEVGGEVAADRKLMPGTPALIAANPALPAKGLVWVVAETDGAIAVMQGGHVTALRTQFVDAHSQRTEDPPWIELRIVSRGHYVLEVVPDVPVELHLLAEVGPALAKARTEHHLDPWNAIDILVGSDVTVQGLVETMVAVDEAGAHAIGLGLMPDAKELALRGHPLRQFYLRRLALDGHSISVPAFRALRELPLQTCYESALAAHPDLAGQVTLTLSLDADGKPHDVMAAGVDDSVAHCIADAVGRASFLAGDPVKASVAIMVAPHEK